MPVIVTTIEPHRVTRIFLDCRDAPPEPLDLRCIERAIEQSIAMGDAVEDTHSQITQPYQGAGDEPAGRRLSANRRAQSEGLASFEHVNVQERIVGDVQWIAIRARGAEWSWLTPQEAVELAREWKERYGAH